VRIEDLRLLSGGASRETWSFDAYADGGPVEHHELILQRTRGTSSTGMTGPSMQTAVGLIAAALRNGVPVPPIVVDSDGAAVVLGGTPPGGARITGRIGGEALGPRIVRDDRFAAARQVLAAQCGRALAGIHDIDPTSVPGLRASDPVEGLRSGLDLLDVARPAFELALAWLESNRPEATRESVVHGDFRIGNLLVDDTGLVAVLDWELAHLGDPVEDLGWLCVRSWRFGGAGLVGGVGDLEDLLAGYRDGGGGQVDPEHVRWWIVAGTLRWGLICAVQARRHLDGHVRSVELATIGRRICETEYDLLQLLGVPAPAAPDDDAGSTAADGVATVSFHGRPTAEELVDAVRDHLLERVAPQLDGAAAFHLKVAANALGIVGRELHHAASIDRAQRDRLARAGVPDEAALASAIRGGDVIGDAVTADIRAAVVDRLRVANPKWLEPPDRP
jgi:aminoglycoside phosphotransferase (APT) family kinase protein